MDANGKQLTTQEEIEALYARYRELCAETNEVQARLYELQGDADSAEFYRSGCGEAAYIRLRAKQLIRSGEHYVGDAPERRAQIEAEAAKLRESEPKPAVEAAA